ncbi:cysteine--tRNA ligase [soil metagenome]
MTLRLRDTLSRQRRALPIDRALSLYVCGITPYDSGHLGHAFTFVQFDVLVRALRWLGHEVNYVQNVTDIDDSILKRARELGADWRRLGDEELDSHLREMDTLLVERPTHLVRATSVMPEIQALIGELLPRDYAYVAGGSAFFRVGSVPTYGELSRLDREAMVEICAQQDDADLDDPRKEDALDVALWKGWSGDQAEPQWPSPWGAGRPGWTIECAAINRRFIGPQVDIHGGGVDLVFPHHETEIALVEAASDRRPFVRTWLHTGMVHHAGSKMAKSVGNLVLVARLIERFSAQALRLYLLSHHYRADWEFSEEGLAAAAEQAERLSAAMDESDRDGERLEADFRAALEDDLNLPRALDVLAQTSGATARRLGGVLGLSGADVGANQEPIHPA